MGPSRARLRSAPVKSIASAASTPAGGPYAPWANVFDGPRASLTEAQFALVEAADGRRPVADLGTEAEAAVRRLAGRGVLDVVQAQS